MIIILLATIAIYPAELAEVFSKNYTITYLFIICNKNDSCLAVECKDQNTLIEQSHISL